MSFGGINRKNWEVMVLIAFALTPILSAVYSGLVRNGTLTTPFVGAIPMTQLILAFLALGEIGAISSLAWRQRLVGTLLVSAGGLLTLPVLFRVVPGESVAATGYVILGLIVVCVVSIIEYVFVHRTQARQFLSLILDRVPVSVATVHVVFAIVLQLKTRTLFSLVGFELIAAVGSLVVLFSITLGAVFAWDVLDLRAPTVLLVGWFVWGTYGALVFNQRLGRFAGVDWSRLNPSPDYLLSTGVLLVLFLAIGGSELFLSRLTNK